MQTRAQVITLGERLPLPVILVETPAPFTYREWYERVLRALDEPFIEEVIYREVGTSLNGKKATTGRGRASTKPLDEAPELRWAVEKALAKRRVLAIFFDEAQHLMANGETEDLKRCWDWLKSLSNTTGVLFVLAGPYPLLKFRRGSRPGSPPEYRCAFSALSVGEPGRLFCLSRSAACAAQTGMLGRFWSRGKEDRVANADGSLATVLSGLSRMRRSAQGLAYSHGLSGPAKR